MRRSHAPSIFRKRSSPKIALLIPLKKCALNQGIFLEYYQIATSLSQVKSALPIKLQKGLNAFRTGG